ncbi:MAG: hypothetical protein ABSF26_26855 [Thermoguttaceae bacterium]|jgi:hypothetical protein
MARNPRKYVAGRCGKDLTYRRLQFEPLDSRALLSAVSLLTPLAHDTPLFTESMPGMPGPVFASGMSGPRDVLPPAGGRADGGALADAGAALHSFASTSAGFATRGDVGAVEGNPPPQPYRPTVLFPVEMSITPAPGSSSERSPPLDILLPASASPEARTSTEMADGWVPGMLGLQQSPSEMTLPPEDSLIVVVNFVPEQHFRPTGQFVAAVESVATSSQMAPFGLPPAVGREVVAPKGMTLTLPQASLGSSSLAGGGLAGLPVAASVAAMEGTPDRTTSTGAIAGRSAEGGFVEIDTLRRKSSPTLEPAQQGPSWDSPLPQPHEPIAGEPNTDHQRQDGPQGAAVDDRPVGDRVDALTDAADSASGSDRTFNAEEGGLVELASAYPSANVPPVSAAAIDPAERGMPADVKEIRLDNGIGRFQAFELASAPAQSTGDADPAMKATGKAALLPEASPPAFIPDVPSTGKSGPLSRLRVGTAERAGSLPLLAVVSLLVAIDGIHREETPAERRRRGPAELEAWRASSPR